VAKSNRTLYGARRIKGTRRPVAVRRRDLRPGDVILDPNGRPQFRVTVVQQSSANWKNFLVLGDQLVPGLSASGNGETLLPVLRIVESAK
jgi:hypothetical protein